MSWNVKSFLWWFHSKKNGGTNLKVLISLSTHSFGAPPPRSIRRTPGDWCLYTIAYDLDLLLLTVGIQTWLSSGVFLILAGKLNLLASEKWRSGVLRWRSGVFSDEDLRFIRWLEKWVLISSEMQAAASTESRFDPKSIISLCICHVSIGFHVFNMFRNAFLLNILFI